MKGILKVIQFGALVYALICVVDALFLPSTVNLWFDNLFFPFALIHLANVFFLRKDLRIFTAFFVLLFGWGIISDWSNSGRIVPDHVLSIMYFLKWPAIIVSLIENKWISQWKLNFDPVIDVVFISLLGINLFILINPGDLGMQLQTLYSSKEYTQFIYFNEWGAFRLCGTLMSPNDNAAIFGAFALYYLFFREKERWYYLLAAILIIYFTQSRTVLIALLISGGLFVIRDLSLKLSRKTLIIVSSVAVIGLTALVLTSANLRSLLTGEAFTSRSFMVRIGNINQFSSVTGTNKWIGYGKVNDPVELIGFYFDSEYVAILFQFGIIGLILLILFYLYTIFSKGIGGKAPFKRILFIYIALVGMTNFTFLNAKFGVILSVFLAYAFLRESTNVISSPKNNPVSAP